MPDNPTVDMVSVTIDGVTFGVPKGTLVVEAAKRIQREIPVYCYHPKMGPAGLCRICLVEIEGMPKLQIGCNTVVTDGMVVHTQSEKAADGRRAVLELYLVNHPLDCPICDKGGECDLQDFSLAYGRGFSRSADAKIGKPKAEDLGPTIVLDEERCVVCQRCVRFDDLIVGERQLVLKDRGVHNIVATATGDAYRHNYTGNVTELCPVGALTSKTYRFKSRPWDLRRTRTTCTQCAVGCGAFLDTRLGGVRRTMLVEDDPISDGWLCDRGRYNIGFYDDLHRLTQPLYKRDGEFVQIGWDDALALWARAIADAVAADPGSVGALGGGRLTNEEAYLLQHVFRSAGVRNLDWRAGRQRQATPGKGGGRLADIDRAEAILEIGESPAERAPILELRVRKAMRRGARLIRVAPVQSRPPISGSCADVATVGEAVEQLPPGAKRVAVIWDGVDLALGRDLAARLPAGIDLAAYITGEQANARGAEAMGMHPSFGPGYAAPAGGAGHGFAAMLEDARAGKMRVLSILGANPALHFPDGPGVREALEKTPFVVVSELFMTQTAKLATLVLPARGAFEKNGTTTNVAGDALPVNAAEGLDAPDGALSDFEMLIGLAQALHVALPAQDELETAVISHLARAPEGFAFGDARFEQPEARGGSAPEGDGDALRLVVESRIFAGGGTIAHDARLADLRPLPQVAIAPDDAARFGLATGDYVDITAWGTVRQAQGVVDVLVEVRAGLPQGVAALVGGLPDDPANALGERALVKLTNVRRNAAEAAR